MENPNENPEESSQEKPENNAPREEELPEYVEVPRVEMEEMMKKVRKLEEEQKMLREVADRSRLATWEEKNRGEIQRTVSLRTLRGKVILAWETVENSVYKDNNGNFQEKQDVKVHYSDGTEEVVTYRTFGLDFGKVPVAIVSRSEADGNVMLKVRTEDGEEYEVSQAFIN